MFDCWPYTLLNKSKEGSFTCNLFESSCQSYLSCLSLLFEMFLVLLIESRRSSQLIIKATSSDEGALDTSEFVNDLKEKVPFSVSQFVQRLDVPHLTV